MPTRKSKLGSLAPDPVDVLIRKKRKYGDLSAVEEAEADALAASISVTGTDNEDEEI